MGTESEISSAICYLLSDAAAFVSGVTLRIDGAASQGTRMYPLADATIASLLMVSIVRLFLKF
jgi:citronellol/citronellal dehydrogenase